MANIDSDVIGINTKLDVYGDVIIMAIK